MAERKRIYLCLAHMSDEGLEQTSKLSQAFGGYSEQNFANDGLDLRCKYP